MCHMCRQTLSCCRQSLSYVDKSCHNADKPDHAAKISPQSKPISRHHGRCAALKYPPPSGPGQIRTENLCRQSLSYCRQSLSTVARFVIWWMLQTNSWACRQTLSAAVLQTDFVSRFCRQTLSAVYTVHSTQCTVYSTQTMFVGVMKK